MKEPRLRVLAKDDSDILDRFEEDEEEGEEEYEEEDE
jgi:hypothetical protein